MNSKQLHPGTFSLAALAGLVFLGLSATAPAQNAAANLEPLPAEDLASVAQPVREALTVARERVEKARDGNANEIALAEAYGNLADVSFAHDLSALARVAYGNALTLRPDRQEWHYLLGLLEISEGDLEAGIASLTRAIELFPDDHAALIRRGRAFLEAGEFQRAASDFQAAARIVPESPAVLGGLGRAGFQLGEHEAAVNLLEMALERAPQANALHQPLGMAYRALGNTEQARYHLSRSGEVREPVNDPVLDRIRRLSRSPQFYLEAGLGQAEQGNYAQAAALLQQAHLLAPEDDRILRELGEVLARAGELDAARDAFTALIERSTVDAEAYVLLGQVEELRGDFDAALAAYRDALSIDPDFADARESIAFARFNQGAFGEAAERFAELAEASEEPAEQARFVYWQAMIDLAQERCAEAADRLAQARALTEDRDADVLTAVARLRASCLQAGEAELEEAMGWAEALYESAPGIETAATRAMVHAARGEFDDAVDFQAQAMFEALKRYGNLDGRPDLQAAMARYQEGRAAERPFGEGHPVFSPGVGEG
jgi:tetratricopeptide (TPR) repeat protein